ncbi:MAG: hypothetical protein V1811_01095 [Candidatus Micrarchaeota archaeon]
MDNKIFLFIAGAAVMLAVVAAAYFIFMQPSQPQTATPTPTASTEATSTPAVQQQTQTPSATPASREKLHILPYSWGTLQAQSCEGIDRPRVYFFEDPYSYVTVVSKGENVPVDKFIGFFESKFAGEVDVFHKMLPVHSQKMIDAHNEGKIGYVNDRYSKENVDLAMKYFACADSQAKLSEFKKCFYENLQIVRFSDGTQDYLPMNEAELKTCTGSLDSAKLDSCIKTSGMLLALELQDGRKLTEMTVPTAVIDCKYRGHSAYIEDAFCYYYPNTNGC